MKKLWRVLILGCMFLMLSIAGPTKTQAATLFTPRLTAPDSTNKYYIVKKYGGYNECIAINGTKSALPNCVGYAWGRAYEITGKRPNLSRNNARTFYPTNVSNRAFKYGKTPKLGSIVCWNSYSGSSAGHVAVIEKIIGDNITISESSYGGARFTTRTFTRAKLESRFGSRSFQGYIYLGDYKLDSRITIKYDPIGGKGYIPSTTVEYNNSFTTANGSAFSKVGYTLKGWYAYRESDAKYFCKGKGWFTQSEINRKGYTKQLYPFNTKWQVNSSWTKDFTVDRSFRMLAVWSPNAYRVSFNPGYGFKPSVNKTIYLGQNFKIPGSTEFKRPGYKLTGWTVRRTSDNTYYCTKGKKWQPWYKLSGLVSRRLYTPGENHCLDAASWLSSSMKNTNTSFEFTAIWKRI